jgi:hypothetical protein
MKNTMAVEMGFPEQGFNQKIKLSEYVKLDLYDPVSDWAAKTV